MIALKGLFSVCCAVEISPIRSILYSWWTTWNL